MCGIVGYIGHHDAKAFMLEGLRRLEYRGYDSAGIALLYDHQITISKQACRIEQLTESLTHEGLKGHVGIGHTRWATHGIPDDRNAHPHLGGDGMLALVHNGVIENHAMLRKHLQEKGYQFNSDTDSEVIAHLIALCLVESSFYPDVNTTEKFISILQKATTYLEGTYALSVIFKDMPNALYATRYGSPLIIGVGNHEHYIASDAKALAGVAQQIIYLHDRELAVLTEDDVQLYNDKISPIQPEIIQFEMKHDEIDKGDYEHYMLKEIFEQPSALRNTMAGRFNLDNATVEFEGLNVSPKELSRVNRIVLTGCGTSWHSAMVGEYLLEEIARVPVEVEYASELRYRNPPITDGTLIFTITQSGETADTLAALREVKRKGHPTISICNVVDSSIAREADGGIYLYAGPEIGVASTKAFTCQVMSLMMLALFFGRMRHLSYQYGLEMLRDFEQIPTLIEKTLSCYPVVRRVSERFANVNNFLFLGRHYNFPTALEGALKLKEISYIHAEGYPAAEMKHGPIALVDENTPSLFIVTNQSVYDKVLSNMQEIKARGGPIIAVANEGDKNIAHYADEVIYVPKVKDYIQPLVASIPLQLFAYETALLRGCDVDKPRNLAKSVTVE